MKAVLCKELGGPSKLVIEDIPAPELGHTDVRIKVHACGINFFEILMIRGLYQQKPDLPFVPGTEVAGEVLEVGGGVYAVKPGDRVMAVTDVGGYAEEVVTNPALLLPISKNMEYTEAAAFPINYGTAHLALTRRARLQPNETLVVFGAAGGVGLAAVEVGSVLGATVIACASTPEKLELTEQYGAKYTINYSEEDVIERVKAITGGRGADVFFDPVGGDAFNAALRCINWEGRLITVGYASGTIPEVSVNRILLKNISLVGLYWGAYQQEDPATLVRSLHALLEWYRNQRLKPYVSATYPLTGVSDAMQRLIDRESTGKVVLTVGA